MIGDKFEPDRAVGTTPEDAVGTYERPMLERLRAAQKQALGGRNPYEIENRIGIGYSVPQEDLDAFMRWKELQAQEDEIIQNALNGDESYRRNKDEVRARNVVTRDEMRLRGEEPGDPWETEDVPAEDQIITFDRRGPQKSTPKRSGRPAADGDAEVPDLIDDATQGNLVAMQKAAIEKGQMPPVFRTFRMPDGRVIAWNGDEARGGMNHATAREALGLGNARLEHGQFKWGDDLSKTNWYDVTGEGKAPRSVEREVKLGERAGKDPADVVMDMTPEEWVRDLRSIGAVGPGNRITDYPKRRQLAIDRDLVNDGHTIKWEAPGGGKAQISFGAGGRPDIEQVQFRLNGKTTNSDGTNFIPPGEAKATFEKAMSVLEREIIKRDKDIYVFDGATPAHNRFYASATKRLGAPQGYVAVLDAKNGNFAFIKQSRFDSDVAAGRIDPKDWRVIPSKRGAKPVSEWRKHTGLFAVPAGAGLGLAAAQGQREDKPKGPPAPRQVKGPPQRRSALSGNK